MGKYDPDLMYSVTIQVTGQITEVAYAPIRVQVVSFTWRRNRLPGCRKSLRFDVAIN